MPRWSIGFGVIAALVLVGTAEAAAEGKLRARFREHYDYARIDFDGVSERYSGFTNTVNLWWEHDYEWAIGVALNPVLSGGWDAEGRLTSGLGAARDEVRLFAVGAEGVYYWIGDADRWGIFSRGGLYWSKLELDDAPDPQGLSYLVAAGVEYRLWQVGFTPEVGFRQGFFEEGVDLRAFTASIALKLYFLEPLLRGALGSVGSSVEGRDGDRP